jgi:hypothetical protein
MLKWLLVIAGVIFFGLILISEVGQQLLDQNSEFINSLKEVSISLGWVEPLPETSLNQESPAVRIKEETLHMLDAPAKLYLKFFRKSAKPQDESRPWILQGLADEITRDPENRKIIKQWLNSLKQEPPEEVFMDSAR